MLDPGEGAGRGVPTGEGCRSGVVPVEGESTGGGSGHEGSGLGWILGGGADWMGA